MVHVPMESSSWARQREWVQMDSLCRGIFDCPHSTPELTFDGPLVVRSQDIRSGVFRWHEAGRVSAETYAERIARAEPAFGDILYSREGTYFGIAAEMPRNQKVCLGQRMVLIRPNPTKINSRFLRLWLNSPVLSRHIHGFRDGTVAERLNMPTIRGLPVPIFPRGEQDAIAELLGSFDDKIELNRRMNETLEAMAKSIFQDWFVDFGPTRRKIEGATGPFEIMGKLLVDPSHAHELAKLFPAKFGDDGLPAGWTQKPISQLAEVIKGRSYKSSELAPSETALVTLKSFRRGGGYRKGGLKPYTGDFKPVQIVRAGEIVMAQTDVTQAAEIIGRPAIVDADDAFSVLVASLDVAIIRPLNPETYTREFLFQTLASVQFTRHALAHVTGTTVLHLASNALPDFQALVPGDEAVRRFSDLIVPLMRRSEVCRRESHTLTATRDLLLPKLMSGEILLAEARQRAEEAA
ncbi:restriction endonuclease subunit S [Mesorhizobium sp. C120A]|uniref:restriction endonuclease subunit S n=1 Tax=unclassified Mesorhizobium TaxID=325217 RepID=UPI00040E473B|nr:MULTISPECIES: restriction endonuclease subunit S [unclassified Mesorhizobium]WJI44003.1 restriction endonuclease subunit S [Mesorhizobium sp. C120A]